MKMKFLSLALLAVLFTACGSDNDNDEPDINEKGKYLVEMEVTGKSYLAEFHVYNLDKVNLYDEINKKNTGLNSIKQSFSGKISYSTVEPVKDFIANCIAATDSTANLKMIVYKDGKSVYEQTLTVEKHSEKNNLYYTSLNE